MSDNSKIEWTDATWNPVTGCTKVSEGCRNCYAMKFAERWRGTPGHYFENGFDITLRPDKLDQPLKWNRPRKIFVNSMSDLFHQDVPQPYIDQIFGIMLACFVLENKADHAFQILTKRPERMKNYFSVPPKQLVERWSRSLDGIVIMDDPDVLFSEYVFGFERNYLWPLPNVWLGVSVENQKAADERIPLLLQTPAAVRFLSCEPLLGPIDFDAVPGLFQIDHPNNEGYGIPAIDGIDWIIAGGESGPGARPMHPEWARSLRDQCQAAGVAFHFKQWGGVNKAATGRLLDGRTWDEMPDSNKGDKPQK